MYDQEIPASQVKADQFPFPSEGEMTLAVRNAWPGDGTHRHEARLGYPCA